MAFRDTQISEQNNMRKSDSTANSNTPTLGDENVYHPYELPPDEPLSSYKIKVFYKDVCEKYLYPPPEYLVEDGVIGDNYFAHWLAIKLINNDIASYKSQNRYLKTLEKVRHCITESFQNHDKLSYPGDFD